MGSNSVDHGYMEDPAPVALKCEVEGQTLDRQMQAELLVQCIYAQRVESSLVFTALRDLQEGLNITRMRRWRGMRRMAQRASGKG